MVLQALKHGSAIALLGVTSSLLTAASGPQKNEPAPAQSTPVIRETTSRVLVDVVVTDAQGKAVIGLGKEDFSVKEDGKDQRVLSFDVENANKPDFVPPKLPPMPANTFVDIPPEPERGPLYIIVYDMVNTELDDQANAYKPLLKFIDSIPPGARFALYVNTDLLHLVQGFTTDREVLRTALTTSGTGPHMPKQFLLGRNFGKGDPNATTALFKFLAEYLEGIPGRKNLIWLSSNLPISLSPNLTNEIPSDPDGSKQALEAMMRSQIAIYPISLAGVIVTEERTPSDAGSVGTGAGDTGNHAGGTGFSLTESNRMSAQAIAEYTGGHSYYGDNGVAEILTDATENGSNYYTLSYAPTNEKFDYAARHIEVKLDQKSYKLAYRQVYYALPEGASSPKGNIDPSIAKFVAAKQADSIYADLEHGAPMLHDLLFRVQFTASGAPRLATPEQMADLQDEPAFFRTRHRSQSAKPMMPIKLQKYLVDYLVFDPRLKLNAERIGKPPELEFAVVAYDSEGRMLNAVANDATATTPAGADAKNPVRLHVQQELEAPPGAAWVRVAVRDKLTGHTGALEISLPLKSEPKNQPSGNHGD